MIIELLKELLQKLLEDCLAQGTTKEDALLRCCDPTRREWRLLRRSLRSQGYRAQARYALMIEFRQQAADLGRYPKGDVYEDVQDIVDEVYGDD